MTSLDLLLRSQHQTTIGVDLETGVAHTTADETGNISRRKIHRYTLNNKFYHYPLMRQERECGIESLTAEDALVDPVREEYPRRSHQLVGRVFLVAAVVANEFHSYDLKERDQYTNISY